MTELNTIIRGRHIFGSFVMPWFESYSKCCDLLRDTYNLAIKVDEHEFRSFSIQNCNVLKFSTEVLESDSDIQGFSDSNITQPIMNENNKLINYYSHMLAVKGINSLLESDQPPVNLKYDISKNIFLNIKQSAYFLFGHHQKSFEVRKSVTRNMMGFMMPIQKSDHSFFGFLTCSALFETEKGLGKFKYVIIMIKEVQKMKKWATHCAINFNHRYLIMKAELCMVCHRKKSAYKLYKKSIQAAKASGIQMDIAIAYEISARYYFKTKQQKHGDDMIQKAKDAYRNWGAHAKVAHLEAQYRNK